MKYMNDIENTDIFECRRCGNCCLHFQPHLEMAEAQNIADHLSLSLDEFKAKYADKRWPGHRTMLIRHNQNGCIFMEHGVDNLSLCTIHDFKPQACRDYQPSFKHRECREGLLP